MNAYEEKQEARRQRYEKRADNARQDADQHRKTSDRLVENIPFGQPILVGHHSEKGHRRTIERSQNLMFKMVDDNKRADYYEQKAAAVGSGGISQDDPEAVTKIKAEIEALEATQAKMKETNKLMRSFEKDRKETGDHNCILALEAKGHTAGAATRLLTPDFCGRIGYADYQITNNGANLRRLKKRLEQLQAHAQDVTAEQEIGGIRIVDNVEDNRLQIFFPSIPAEDVRKKLKANGFHWTPSVGAWQRYRSNAAMYHAKAIIVGLKPIGIEEVSDPEKHNLEAEWIDGRGIIVTDTDGREIEVQYGATQDNRTVTAYVNGIGFIGGWQWPSPPLPFKCLVTAINLGILYHSSADLPQLKGKNSRGPRRGNQWERN